MFKFIKVIAGGSIKKFAGNFFKTQLLEYLEGVLKDDLIKAKITNEIRARFNEKKFKMTAEEEAEMVSTLYDVANRNIFDLIRKAWKK